MTNHHKLSVLKQYRFIVLYFWRSKVQNGSHGAKSKVSAVLHSFLATLKNAFPCVSQLLEATHIFLGSWPLPLSAKPAVWGCLSHAAVSNSLLSCLPSTCKGLCGYTEPTWRMQDKLSTSELANVIPFCCVTPKVTGPGGWDMDTPTWAVGGVIMPTMGTY